MKQTKEIDLIDITKKLHTIKGTSMKDAANGLKKLNGSISTDQALQNLKDCAQRFPTVSQVLKGFCFS
jgi:hypothetical protein